MKSNYHNELSNGNGQGADGTEKLNLLLWRAFRWVFWELWDVTRPGRSPVSVGVREPRARASPDPGTRSSWPYVRLPAARPECHLESTALNSSYMLSRGLSLISTSVLAGGPPSGLPLLGLCSQTLPSRPLGPFTRTLSYTHSTQPH